MINYTNHIAHVMNEIVARVPALSFIDTREVLVFARLGRSSADGAFATCHCLSLPASEPAYYFWRDRRTGSLTRRSEWFVAKSPSVQIGSQRVSYLVSFALPRFCDQVLARSQKAALYPGAEPWIAKLDTIVHELYHIDPDQQGIRRVTRADGASSHRSHAPRFFEDVARMVQTFLASRPDPATYEFLRHDFSGLHARYGEVVGRTFRNFPSFPQRYVETLADQPSEPSGSRVESLKTPRGRIHYTERDLQLRQFLRRSSCVWGAAREEAPARAVHRFELAASSIACDSARPEIPGAPVARAEGFDAHHAGRGRRMDEPIPANRDGHMGRAGALGRKEQ